MTTRQVRANVLFDAPGPKTRRRYRIYSVVAGLVLLGLVALVVWRLYDSGQFDSRKWEVFQYSTVQEQLWKGLLGTLKAFALAAVFSLTLGTLLAVGQLSDHRVIRWPATAFVQFFRAMPLLVLVFFLYIAPPLLGWWQWSNIWPLVVGLSVYNGTVQAETIRAGILSVPRGQSEAAYAVGMRKGQVMSLVLVPQAVRAMLPSIIGQLVVTLKDTSLGYLITYDEFLRAGKRLGEAQQFDFPFIPVVIVLGIVYIGICMALSGVATWLERRWGTGVRLPRRTRAQLPTVQ